MRNVILLDLDGTIVDSYESVLQATEKSLTHFNIRIPSELYEVSEVGDMLSVACKYYCGHVTQEEFKLVYDSILLTNPTKGVYVNKSALELISNYIKNGYSLVVLTNKKQEVAEIICKDLFPPNTFLHVIGRNTVKPLKPSGNVFEELRKRGILLNDIYCLIGDSETDKKTALLLRTRYVDIQTISPSENVVY